MSVSFPDGDHHHPVKFRIPPVPLIIIITIITIDHNNHDDQPRSPPAEKMRKGMFGATALKQSPAVPKMLPDEDYDDHDDHHDLDGDHGAVARFYCWR